MPTRALSRSPCELGAALRGQQFHEEPGHASQLASILATAAFLLAAPARQLAMPVLLESGRNVVGYDERDGAAVCCRRTGCGSYASAPASELIPCSRRSC